MFGILSVFVLFIKYKIHCPLIFTTLNKNKPIFPSFFICRCSRPAIKTNIVEHDGLSDQAFIINVVKKEKKEHLFTENFPNANMM